MGTEINNYEELKYALMEQMAEKIGIKLFIDYENNKKHITIPDYDKEINIPKLQNEYLHFTKNNIDKMLNYGFELDYYKYKDLMSCPYFYSIDDYEEGNNGGLLDIGIDPTDRRMIYCNGNSGVLTKDSVGKLIEYFIDIYNNYEDLQQEMIVASTYRMIENTANFLLDWTRKRKSGKKISDNKGYVYIMKSMGVYKIGIAGNSCARLGEYTKLPEEPVYYLCEYVSDNREIEKDLQEMFKDKRRREGKCEWFDLSDSELKKAIKYVKKFSINTNNVPSFPVNIVEI